MESTNHPHHTASYKKESSSKGKQTRAKKNGNRKGETAVHQNNNTDLICLQQGGYFHPTVAGVSQEKL